MEQEESQQLSQFIQINPVKVLFIKLTAEKKSRYTPWPVLSRDSSSRFIAAEVEASQLNQQLNLSAANSAEVIFFVIDPSEFNEVRSGQAENLQHWLALIGKHNKFNNAKTFFLFDTSKNPRFSNNATKTFSEKIKKIKEKILTDDPTLELPQVDLNIIYYKYESLNQSHVSNDSPLVLAYLSEFSARFASVRHVPPHHPPVVVSKQSLKRAIEIAGYGAFLFLSTLGVVILIGAILGGASGSWSDIIASGSSWIFDVNLLNNAIEAAFNGLGTSWSLGVVISAFLVAGIVAAVVVSWGAYDYFNLDLPPEEEIDEKGWMKITENETKKHSSSVLENEQRYSHKDNSKKNFQAMKESNIWQNL